MSERIILASDIHDCHSDWYGTSCEERMECFVDDLWREYGREPYGKLLFLGDYSLDFWEYSIKGCWIERGFSYTDHFIKTYVPRLPVKPFLIPGNHEQYGQKLWRQITGGERQFVVKGEQGIFLMMDTYAGDLDPKVHSDGTYTGLDVPFIRQALAGHPGKKAVLCCHFLDPGRLNEEEKEVLRDPAIVCVFAGHTHVSSVIQLPQDCGGKVIIQTGNYSYGMEKDPFGAMWGYRDLVWDDRGIFSSYIVWEHPLVRRTEDGKHPFRTMDEIRLIF